MPNTILIAFNGTTSMGQFLGDTLTSLKTAWLFVQNGQYDRVLLTMSPRGELNFLWRKFIDTYSIEVIYDDFDPGNMPARFEFWNRLRTERQINGIPFDHYRELYRRIDGGDRQGILCQGERGLGRKNIFEYFYYGQEEAVEPCVGGDHFKSDLIYHPTLTREKSVLVAPHAKCQGNAVFTFDYWADVVHRLIDAGIDVTVNHNGPFCEDLNGHPLYRKIFPSFPDLLEEICQHKIVSCGNTGVGWLAGAAGVPLLGMQPVDSHIQDYRYEWCGVRSLIDFLEQPDPAYCVERIREELDKRLVLTTGCYDTLHAGHVKHLAESRSLGTRLVVCLNSDASVKRLKGSDRPLNRQDDRKTVLEAIRHVDEVRIIEGDDASDIIEELRPAVITNGPDHKAAEVVGKAFVEAYGGQVVITGGARTISTTSFAESVIKRHQLKSAEINSIIRNVAHLSVNPPAKLRHMAEAFLSVAGLPGDAADVGAYKGATGKIMRSLATGRRLHLFDTWTGTPMDDEMCHHKKGEWAASLDEVKTLFGDDGLTTFHEGVFPDTAAELNGVLYAFAYIDGDTYQTTRDAIAYFWPRLAKGGKLYFDDVPWEPCAGVEKAIREAFAAVQLQLNPETYSCVVVKT